jgi:CBS domain containing-hemolysin-like protein
MLSELGRIPAEGEQLGYKGFDYVAARVRGPRIEQITIRRRKSGSA